MSLPFNKEQLTPLKIFIDLCMKNPQILKLPDLDFVRKFIEHFGGKIPDNAPKEETTMESEGESGEKWTESGFVDENEISEESDLELDNTEVIEPDNDPPQEMGDLTLNPSEEEITEAQAKRSEAVSAFVEKDYNKAIELYTQAIKLNPHAALFYAKRGQIYLLLKKPNACIRDCSRAIELNPDSAAAHKFRGRANQLLGKWEEAVHDLRLACKFDFDEQADEWLREVTPNARKIEEHKRKIERKLLDKAEKKRQESLKKTREEINKSREKSTAQNSTNNQPGGNIPFMSDFYQYMNDPEVLQAFQDPEVSAAFLDISTNPANIFKYQKNPKIMNLIKKVTSKFGGGAGMPGNMPGGFFPGQTNPSTTPDDDVGLD